MEKFSWTPQYSVHVAQLDEQHKRFFAICNELQEFASAESFSRKEAITKVMALADYMFYHFETEEALFKNSEYKEVEMHLKSHQYFRDTVNSYVDQVRDVNIDARYVLEEVADFAVHWLQNHILETDQKYSDFIKNS